MRVPVVTFVPLGCLFGAILSYAAYASLFGAPLGDAPAAAVSSQHAVERPDFSLRAELTRLQSELATAQSTINELRKMERDQPTQCEPVKPELPLASPAPQPQAECAPAGSPAAAGTAAAAVVSEIPRTRLETECDARFGYGLVRLWRAAKSDLCTPVGPDGMRLTCYEYKQVGHWRSDTFCEATNIVVDFGKVKGVHFTGAAEPRGGDMFHDYDQGAFSGACQKQGWSVDRFILQHRRMMEAFQPSSQAETADEVVDLPHFFITRDEDAHNFFHGGCDMVVLFDRNLDGPLFDMYQRAFSPRHPIRRAVDFGGKRVRFKRLVFSLAGKASPYWTDTNTGVPCGRSGFFQAMGKHILDAFGLWEVEPPSRPSVTLSVRRRTSQRNVGRIITNEGALEQVLRSGSEMDVRVVDLAAMSFEEQLRTARSTNVYIGMHGAGLTHAFFLAQEAVMIEMHPSYRADRHFRNAARYAGKIYFPWRSRTKPTYQGTSDETTVDADEFRAMVDAAVRMARNFGTGVKECGLNCPQQLVIGSFGSR